ncbi:MAG: hypothetical protein GY765_01065, partial [bacterium]|nr:hypothetical protein [bacterium]
MKMKYISAQALLVLLCLLLHACGGDHKAGVAVMDVKKGTFDITIPAVGELQAVTSTPISLPPYLRGSQTIAWMAPENSLVKKGEIVARLDGTTYKERIETEEFAIAKINLEIEKKEKELEKEKKDLLSEIDITGIEKKLAELYGAKDKQLYSANEIIDAAIDLGYLKAKDAHYLRQQDKLEKKSGAELQLLSLRRKTHSVKIGQYK